MTTNSAQSEPSSSDTDQFLFQLVYVGPEVDEGTIDARDLGPALLGFAELVRSSNAVLFPENEAVTLRVQSNFRRGSFEVLLELARIHQQFVTLFSSSTVQAWTTLLSVLGISGAAGLWQLLKRLNGRKPRRLTVERTERITIEFDGETAEIPIQVWELLEDTPVRHSVQAVVSPLKQDGIDRLEIRKSGETVLEVNKSDVDSFRAPNPLDEADTFTNPNAKLRIVSPSFGDGHKWRVNDGSQNIWVGIEDSDFIERVNRGEAFKKGDVLRVTLRTTQVQEGNTLKASYDIVKVHAHVHPSAANPQIPGLD